MQNIGGGFGCSGSSANNTAKGDAEYICSGSNYYPIGTEKLCNLKIYGVTGSFKIVIQNGQKKQILYSDNISDPYILNNIDFAGIEFYLLDKKNNNDCHVYFEELPIEE